MKVPSVFLLFILPVFSAPKSRDRVLPQTVYDQKQHGDYNIQLHLKDFQIIALVGDDALGDYDYNYDYSDFTIKPTVNVTLKPPTTVTATSTSSVPENETINVSNSSINSEKPENISTSVKPENNVPENVTDKLGNASIASPDKIKVQIIEDAPGTPTAENNNNPPTLGEVLHYRRCATGFTKDKKGRCRRVRRPGVQVPFDISRLATNIAAKFRQPPSTKRHPPFETEAEIE